MAASDWPSYCLFLLAFTFFCACIFWWLAPASQWRYRGKVEKIWGRRCLSWRCGDAWLTNSLLASLTRFLKTTLAAPPSPLFVDYNFLPKCIYQSFVSLSPHNFAIVCSFARPQVGSDCISASLSNFLSKQRNHSSQGKLIEELYIDEEGSKCLHFVKA